MSGQNSISTQNLSIGYLKKKSVERTISQNINLEAHQGEFIVLIGPNGAGKTTLLRTLSGILPPLEGNVSINNKNIEEYKQIELSKSLSVVLTDQISSGNLTVREVIALGRTPYLNWLGAEKGEDHDVVEKMAESTGISHLLDRKTYEISDGEKQRLMVARALAQDTNIILLDEPTAHLDITNRVKIIHLLKDIAHKKNITVILSSHELSLAIQCADRIWLINDHGKITDGLPEELILNGVFQDSFSGEGLHFDPKHGDFTVKSKVIASINIEGKGLSRIWTEKALYRLGFQNVNSACDIKITVSESGNNWILSTAQSTNKFNSLSDLTSHLITYVAAHPRDSA